LVADRDRRLGVRVDDRGVGAGVDGVAGGEARSATEKILLGLDETSVPGSATENVVEVWPAGIVTVPLVLAKSTPAFAVPLTVA
jgi:hypothetical protein